jgi:DNA repair exonuclease SbcCD ATPase subunit
MIVFSELKLRNFLSYGNNITTVDLSQPGTTLIIGEDLDNTSNGRGGNGCGKSSILNALVYALYDKPISDISKDNLVNNINKKNMEVTLKFTDDNGVQYEVRRERGSRAGAAGNNVYLFINGDDKTLDSQAATNAKIAQVIGIPYELFVRIVVFSASHMPFLDIKTEQQKEIIEELFGLTTISQKAELLKLEIKDTKVRIQFKKSKLDSLIAEHERHTQQIVSAKQRVVNWEVQHDAALEQIKDFDPTNTHDYDVLSTQLKTEVAILREAHRQDTNELRDYAKQQASTARDSIKQQLDQLRSDLSQQVAALRQQEVDDTSTLACTNDSLAAELTGKTTELSKVTQERLSIQATIKQHKVEITKYQTELEHLSSEECPYCFQTFAEAAARATKVDKKVVQLLAELPMFDAAVDEATVKEKHIHEEIKSIKTAVAENKALIDAIHTTSKTSVRNVETDLGYKIAIAESDIEKEVSAIEAKVNQSIRALTIESDAVIHEKTIKTEEYQRIKREFDRNLTKYTELTTAINPYVDPLDELLNIKLDAIDYVEVNDLTREFDHQEFLLKLLTKKDSFVRKALLNKNVPLLNTRLRYYLSHLGLPHKVEFTKEMAATISQFGRELDFGNLSAGQRARVNFALSLAFRDVLQNLHPKINICMLDEILDTALDSVGVQAAAKIIKQKARDEGLSMYVISHRDEIDSVFNNKMVIQMKDGFSTIKAKYEDTSEIVQ